MQALRLRDLRDAAVPQKPADLLQSAVSDNGSKLRPQRNVTRLPVANLAYDLPVKLGGGTQRTLPGRNTIPFRAALGSDGSLGGAQGYGLGLLPAIALCHQLLPRRQAVPHPVFELAPLLVVLTSCALANHPDLLHHPARGRVGAEVVRVDAVQTQNLEPVAHHLSCGLGAVAEPPVGIPDAVS